MRGQVLLIVTVFFLVTSLSVIVGLVAPITREVQTTNNYKLSHQSFAASESLAEDMAFRMKNGRPVQNSETLAVGGASAAASVASSLGGKTITSTGMNANLERVTAISLRQGVGIAFNYGVQAGEGGFILSGGSTIHGSVYSDGIISALNGVHITGSAIVANSPGPTVNQANDTPMPPPSSITFGNAVGTQDMAQSFQVQDIGTVSRVDLYLKKVGTPGNITVHLTTDTSGHPASTDIVNATMNASLITTSYGWVTVVFPDFVQLQPGTTYWIVANASSNSNNYYIAGANSAFGGGQGAIGKFTGSWGATSPAGLDAYFRMYYGGIMSSIGGDNNSGGVIIGSEGQGIAWAHTVTGATVTANLYCQSGAHNNKACDTSRPDPAPQPLPISDGNIADWKAEAEAGGTIQGNYHVDDDGATLGPKKITGNLLIDGGGTLMQTGTIWVQGTFTITGGGHLKIPASFGSAGSVLIVDGKGIISGGATLTGSGASGSYPLVLTTSNCPFNSSCNGANALSLDGGASSVILVAQNGTLNIEGGSNIKEATGYQISVSGGADLTYDTGIADMLFTNGPSGGYTIGSWQEVAP